MKIFLFIQFFNPPHVILNEIDVENGSLTQGNLFLDLIIVINPGIAINQDTANSGFFLDDNRNNFALGHSLGFNPNIVKVPHFIDGFGFITDILRINDVSRLNFQHSSDGIGFNAIIAFDPDFNNFFAFKQL